MVNSKKIARVFSDKQPSVRMMWNFSLLVRQSGVKISVQPVGRQRTTVDRLQEDRHISHDGSMVLLYMVTWIPSIYPLYVSINIPAPWIRHGIVDHQQIISRNGSLIIIIIYHPLINGSQEMDQDTYFQDFPAIWIMDHVPIIDFQLFGIFLGGAT